MKALIQRVSMAKVEISGELHASIEKGLLVLLGVGKHDSEREADWLAEKISGLRIFSDPEGKMNLSLQDIKGECLIVSQFTLYGDCRKGRRPGFDLAAPPKLAEELYKYFVKKMQTYELRIATGKFAADMQISLLNDGPVTFMLEQNFTEQA